MNRVDYRASSSQHKAAQKQTISASVLEMGRGCVFLGLGWGGMPIVRGCEAREGLERSFIRSREKRIQHHRSKLGNGDEKEIQSNRYTDLDLQTRFVTIQLLL